MKTQHAITTRRSIRKFKNRPVEKRLIHRILEAGRWAPSGLNNQPWRFTIVRDREMIRKIAGCTLYSHIVLRAPALIVVFIDTAESYNRTKDLQAVGACIQNMLLSIHDLRLGGCWLGEILNQKQKVEKILRAPSSYELMAVIAVGYPHQKRTGTRKPLHTLIHSC